MSLLLFKNVYFVFIITLKLTEKCSVLPWFFSVIFSVIFSQCIWGFLLWSNTLKEPSFRVSMIQEFPIQWYDCWFKVPRFGWFLEIHIFIVIDWILNPLLMVCQNTQSITTKGYSGKGAIFLHLNFSCPPNMKMCLAHLTPKHFDADIATVKNLNT